MAIFFVQKNIHIQIYKFFIYLNLLSFISSNQNILIFNSKHYRAGRSAFTSNGDMVIEYSYQNYRLLYGLKKNGKNFLKEKGESVQIKEIVINSTIYERYESRNIFISLNNTNNNNNNEYLFSYGTYSETQRTLAELYDINTWQLQKKDCQELLGQTVFSYASCLYSINDANKYIISYITSSSSFLQIISFSDFDLNDIIVESIEEREATLNWRFINSFQMNDNIILLYYKSPHLYINIYDLNLNLIKNDIKIIYMSISSDCNSIFFKGIHLYGNTIAIMLFSQNNYKNLEIKIGYIYNNTEFKTNLSHKFSNYNIYYDCTLSDFIKINNNRLAYIGKSEDNDSIFKIILFDLYNNIQNMKIRIFNFELTDFKISKELEAIVYNNYLALSSTIVNKGVTSSSDEYKYSIFLIFGYVNGTDGEINIYKYTNENIFNNNNLVTDLTENAIINNNIFGYEILKDRIKLVYIPEHILFFNNNNREIQLQNDDVLFINYTLKINEEFNINNSYLEYQIIISETDFDNFNNYSIDIINCSMENNAFIDENDYYNKTILYGRTNTLIIINNSCHEFCLTCSELGNSNNNQKCISCKEEYNYFHSSHFSGNCIPQGNFYDNENNILIECIESNSKFYIDENGKRICFKNNRDCPNDYPYLKENTNECTKNSEFSYDNPLTNNELSNEEEYNYMLDLLSNYSVDEGNPIYYKTENNIYYALTTPEIEKRLLNELNANNNLSIIEFDKCETILRESHQLNDKNISLIILKSENINNIPSERNVQYEIFESLNKTKLNLSLCNKAEINLYFKIELNNKTQKLYDDLKNYGYDLFNINDKFYQDICTPYKSENNTDILLSDRINDIYYKNNKLTICQDGCEYSGYISENKLLKCKCNVNQESIEYNNINKFTPKKIYESFYDILKYSNYKIIKCYNLIINGNLISSNLGSIIILSLSGIYFLFLFIFLVNGINPLKINIFKSLYNNKNIIINNNNQINNNQINNNPKNNNKRKSIRHGSSKKRHHYFPPIKNNINKNKNTTKRESKQKIVNQNLKLSIFNNNINANYSNNKMLANLKQRNSKIDNENINLYIQEEQNNLDDFELNNLDYFDAKKLDKRSFLSTYWSILKREHKIIFTFFIWNDYNLYYIKFIRFIFLVCTDLALNVIFFSDESMHKIYINYGKYDFIQQIPQMVYIVAVSQLIEVFICYLSLTDKHYYQIKTSRKINGINNDINNKVFNTLKCIKYKLICFFVFTFLFLGFYYYLISCFCAVYRNTQKIFIKDFLLSFFAGLIYPIILYLIPSVLRIISLRVSTNFSCLYKISDIIPIF